MATTALVVPRNQARALACNAESARSGTNGARFHPSLDRFIDFKRTVDVIVSKGQYSAAYSGFEGVDQRGRKLESILRGEQITSVDVVGIATDFCVRATVLDALEAGFPVRLLTDMTAGLNPTSSRKALKDMKGAGARIVTSR